MSIKQKLAMRAITSAETEQEVKQALEEAGTDLYLYGPDYVNERADALERWNALLPLAERLNINWRDYYKDWRSNPEYTD